MRRRRSWLTASLAFVTLLRAGVAWSDCVDSVLARPPAFFTSGVGPTGIAVGDLNGDGNPDIVAANTADAGSAYAGSGLCALFGDGRGGFTAGPSMTTVAGPSSVAL